MLTGLCVYPEVSAWGRLEATPGPLRPNLGHSATAARLPGAMQEAGLEL